MTGGRLSELLSTLPARRAERTASLDTRLSALEREAAMAEGKLTRSGQPIEAGVTEMDDLLKERITTLKADRGRGKEALNRAECGVRAKSEVSPESVEQFGTLMRERIPGSNTRARKARMRHHRPHRGRPGPRAHVRMESCSGTCGYQRRATAARCSHIGTETARRSG